MGEWADGQTGRGSPAEVSFHPGLLQKNMEAPPHQHVGQYRGSKGRLSHGTSKERGRERDREAKRERQRVGKNREGRVRVRECPTLHEFITVINIPSKMTP